MSSNLERMIQLAEEFFAVRNDPAQISVTEEVMKRLRQIHPATLTEEKNSEGPIAWILLIPTNDDLMKRFIAKRITEQELFERTPLHGEYDAIYLCSALVLPEHRGKGLAKRLAVNAINAIKLQHPIRSLFYWSFSNEGTKLATSIATELHISLLAREQ